jgi:hypothetical protein
MLRHLIKAEESFHLCADIILGTLEIPYSQNISDNLGIIMWPANFGQIRKVEIIFCFCSPFWVHMVYVGKNNIRSSCEHLEGVFLTL